MRKTSLLLAAEIAVVVASMTPSKAQEIGQSGRGLEYARQLCGRCHAVEKRQARSSNEDAPRFEVIASVPGMTAIALSAALNTSHRTMPNIVLAVDEQADIIAYILSLKRFSSSPRR